MDWLLSKGASSFFSIEGLTLGPLYKERMVLGYSNNRKDLGQFGVLPTTEGAISGINAVLFEECLRQGLSWTSLFVPTSRVSTIDYGGAAAIIEVLDKIFHLSVDVSQLKKMEENIRQMYERQMKTGSRGLLGRFRGS
jgi:predicted ATP-grasp superfamily ATP-dependent carboligase